MEVENVIQNSVTLFIGPEVWDCEIWEKMKDGHWKCFCSDGGAATLSEEKLMLLEKALEDTKNV